jgi:hypothetical protein
VDVVANLLSFVWWLDAIVTVVLPLLPTIFGETGSLQRVTSYGCLSISMGRAVADRQQRICGGATQVSISLGLGGYIRQVSEARVEVNQLRGRLGNDMVFVAGMVTTSWTTHSCLQHTALHNS